ncbi:MAG: peroxiredoxin-like family protein [Limisphaerales bacterium]
MLNPVVALLLSSATLLAAAPAIKHLSVGDAVPDVVLRTEDDQQIKLRQLVSAKPTVLIFYRGGWCPFCNRHLKELAGIEKDLDKAGAQLVAISMDQPAKLKATPNRDQLGYRLLSDNDAAAAQAFGIAFKVDDATVERYKGFKIDLEAASGRSHHLLPHPAVFVADTKGVIRFAHVNADYKVRLAPAKILEAVRGVQP